jgi:hypothetical protein
MALALLCKFEVVFVRKTYFMISALRKQLSVEICEWRAQITVCAGSAAFMPSLQ